MADRLGNLNLPAPSLPLRNLTLGVLIVAGGTLAALPFRRLHEDRSSLDASVRATGPTSTPLDSALTDLRFDRAPQPATEQLASHTVESPYVASADFANPSPAGTYPVHGAIGFSSSANVDRSISIPSSYDDLRVAVPRPQVLAERFSASVTYQSQANEERRAIDRAIVSTEPIGVAHPTSIFEPVETLPMPTEQFESLAGTEPMPQRDPVVYRPAVTATPTGHVASATDRIETAPLEEIPAKEVDRQRFWIRQP